MNHDLAAQQAFSHSVGLWFVIAHFARHTIGLGAYMAAGHSRMQKWHTTGGGVIAATIASVLPSGVW